MRREDVISMIRDKITGIFDENNVDIVDIIYRQEGSVKVLRILADTEEGITIGECARMNEIVSEALDNEDLINEKYILEIASPGMDRHLSTKKDFLKLKGKKVQVYTYAPVNDRKEFNGPLEAVDDEGITVLAEGGRAEHIPFSQISKATLDYKNLV
ncbi:MAG: ribosome maturation factor RimP [Candidatus Omnitrophica bacterium]|nr:ribosome maturation factor RimP [Candidatus Omnitrophota bacterium]